MHGGEFLLAWILFWLFTTLSTVATFLIVRHHHGRRRAVGLSLLVLLLFIALYLGLRAFLHYLGL
jgi:hypothetical protein